MSQTDLIQWFLNGPTKYTHKPIVYDKLHGAKLDELIEYSNAMETRIHALIRAVKKHKPQI